MTWCVSHMFSLIKTQLSEEKKEQNIAVYDMLCIMYVCVVL